MSGVSTNTGSQHKCDQCGKTFMYPAKHRPWGLPGQGDGGCCPCYDCDPESFRECIAQDIKEGELAPDYTWSTR